MKVLRMHKGHWVRSITWSVGSERALVGAEASRLRWEYSSQCSDIIGCDTNEWFNEQIARPQARLPKDLTWANISRVVRIRLYKSLGDYML